MYDKNGRRIKDINKERKSVKKKKLFDYEGFKVDKIFACLSEEDMQELREEELKRKSGEILHNNKYIDTYGVESETDLDEMYLPTRGTTLSFVLTTLLFILYSVKIFILSEGRSLKGYHQSSIGSSLLNPLRHPSESGFEVGRRSAGWRGERTPLLKIPELYPPRGKQNRVDLVTSKRSVLPHGSILTNWKEGAKKLVNRWGLVKTNKEENTEVHPLKNCRWEITTFNFLLQKKTSFFIHINENGTVKMPNDVQGTWSYSNYYLTWTVEHPDRRVYYTAELLWNGDKSKLVKGIIYEEKKRRRFFLPAYFFRKILGSFEGRVASK
ncbi:Uncharacterized protein PCOAH_00042830 [Plasmodium coatneyi]|uniref:Uncharacterized protein n=1 Tax=Plasmodium coatneyi TaxID=208452 RepID=A0A1B1E5G2_9APIC|nr:Uncharacterized protein PCOAH_00042830 [Plasmodium coatneyi]ANQ10231.1 Uncharacterized protein PCOAH_00042830 [Plasmodium coatneyi]